MIAVDTSSLVAFFQDLPGQDVNAVEAAFDQKIAVFSPIVLSEMLSDHKLSPVVIGLIKSIPTLPLKNGFWERAGLLRSQILKRGHKARLADTLIAQNCIDYRVSLITRDADFRHFAKYGDLRLWS